MYVHTYVATYIHTLDIFGNLAIIIPLQTPCQSSLTMLGQSNSNILLQYYKNQIDLVIEYISRKTAYIKYICMYIYYCH